MIMSHKIVAISTPSTAETVKQDYLDLRKTSVEARLETMFQQLVSSPFTLTDSQSLNPVPTAAEFTKKAAQLLTLLFETMCPGLAERSLSNSDRWLALMAAAKGIEISPRIFDSVRATGPSGTDLDTRLARLQNSELKTAFGDFLNSIREKKYGLQEGIEKQRWEAAEKRVGMAVETLLGNPDIRPDQAAACCELIDRWTVSLSHICSVGVDLQLMAFQEELATIFGGVNQSTLNTKIANWVLLRVSELLREKCAIPLEFSQDVHHVNLAIRLISEHMGGSSTDFPDPYEAGMPERVTAQKAAIAKEFLEVSPLLDTLHCSSGLSLDELVSGGAIKTGDTHALDPMAWRRLAESCMKELDFETFKSMGIGIPELDGNLGCHGRLGIAARLGKVDYFNEILKQQPIDPKSVFTRDVFDCTLMDYAALGGNVAILDSCLAGVSAPDWATLFADSPLPRNPLALAAESGNAAMVARVAGLVGNVWTPRLMTARDEQGFDPLMRGVMSENVAVVSQVMALFNDPNVRLETVNAQNRDGQTPLILAIESGSPEITGLLLGAGADPNARVSGSDDGISPLEWAMSKGNSAVVRVLLTHEGITLHESVIRYAANRECLLPLVAVACERLVGDDLAFVVGIAIESKKLNADDCMKLCRAIRENLTGYDLINVLNAAIRHEELTDSQRGELKAMASDKGVRLE